MLNIIRRSQIIGLMAIDSATASRLGNVEEIWLDESGDVKYLSSHQGYWPLSQVSGVGGGAVSVYHKLLVGTPPNLYRWHQIPVQSSLGEPLGWVEDFLFDWHTGEISAYILAGEKMASAFGERAVLLPEDVVDYAADAIIVQEGTQQRLKSESDGLRGFLSEKSNQVKSLVQEMVDRLHSLISPDDQPERVRIKVKQVSEELAASGEHDHQVLKEATEFLHEQWASLQHSISRKIGRAQSALEAAWQEIIKPK